MKVGYPKDLVGDMSDKTLFRSDLFEVFFFRKKELDVRQAMAFAQGIGRIHTDKRNAFNDLMKRRFSPRQKNNFMKNYIKCPKLPSAVQVFAIGLHMSDLSMHNLTI